MSRKRNKAGVIGWPISHSLSPMVHGAWLFDHNIDGTYEAIACPPDQDHFRALIKQLYAGHYAGCNVTLPHKAHAALVADTRSEIVARLGVANTLIFSDQGIHAENTDVPGFAAALKTANITATPDKAVILGAGGATPAIILALAQAGYREIVLTNRTHEKAMALAKAFQEISITVAAWEDRSTILEDCDVFINTSALGMAGSPALDIDLSNLSPHAVVADIVYTPLKTALLQQAEDQGHTIVNGLDMLLYQAIPGFKAWFGVEPEVTDALRQILVKKLTSPKQPEPPLKIGLTGSIGMGKSTMAGIFAGFGVPVWNADAAVHRLYGPDGAAVAPLAEAFPHAVKANQVDRAQLSAHLLDHPEDFPKLETIVHPLVYADEQAFIEKAAQQGAQMVLLDIPLLFENRGKEAFEKIVVVSAPEAVQRQRVLARPGMTVEKFDNILARQLPDAEKRAQADFVIETDKDFATARQQIYGILRSLDYFG